jgi:hypothetical protein
VVGADLAEIPAAPGVEPQAPDLFAGEELTRT